MKEIFNKTILAIDTSTVACSVALLHQGEVRALHELTPQKHAQRVLPMIEELLTDACIQGQQVDAIAFGEGPGAFTGVRIASGVVQGLCLGWDCDFIAISSLEAMIYQAAVAQSGGKKIHWCALMDARMNEIYFQQGIYDPEADLVWQADKTHLISPLEVVDRVRDLVSSCEAGDEEIIVVGDISKEYPEIAELSASYLEILPSAHALLRLAEIYWDKKNSLADALPMPLYLRNQIAETIEQRAAKRAMQSR